MNVYRVTTYDGMTDVTYLAAKDWTEAAASVSPKTRSVELLGPLDVVQPAVSVPPAEPAPTPATPEEIAASITPDALVCFEDGKTFKSLKRHLRVHYGLTPDQYRKKWGLPTDYPMVAPNYSATRSRLAKNSGLGRR